MRYGNCLFFSLSILIFAQEEKSGSQTKLIETYIVNKTKREFQGSYTFVVEEGVAVKHKQENFIKIKPGHKQTLRLLGFTHLANKLSVDCPSYSTKYILHIDKFAISVSDLAGATMPVDFIEPMSVFTAITYPETPAARSCVII
jgi:hypothetical protein